MIAVEKSKVGTQTVVWEEWVLDDYGPGRRARPLVVDPSVACFGRSSRIPRKGRMSSLEQKSHAEDETRIVNTAVSRATAERFVGEMSRARNVANDV